MVIRSEWTVIVAAAGRGTRLGSTGPKILHRIGDTTFLERLAFTVGNWCAQAVIVASPVGAAPIAAAVSELAPTGLKTQCRVVIQEEPTGTADAVGIALRHVQTPNVAVLWGDQIGLSRATFQKTLLAHRLVTLPLAFVTNPYVHFVRSESGVRQILYRVSGDAMPVAGWQDVGLSTWRVWALERALSKVRVRARGSELNFLSVFPALSTESDVGVMITDALESDTWGINTPLEAEAFLHWERQHGKFAR